MTNRVQVVAGCTLACAFATLTMQEADASATTILCRYRAPEQSTFTFVLDIPNALLVTGPDIQDGGTTVNAPLTLSENEIAWTTNDGWRLVLDRMTMVLSGNSIVAFDCSVAHKQL
jgi:hypothetical protein